MATIDLLLNLVPDHSASVLSHLASDSTLASAQDGHGYSLLHAAASYNQLTLATALIQTYRVDPNLLDEDGETCLFNAETVEVATALLELGVDPDLRNAEGVSAEGKLADEDEWPAVAAFLKARREGTAQTDGGKESEGVASVNGEGRTSHSHPPPPLPDGVQINMGTMVPGEEGGEPDPEFRRRIEELAARPDFESEETQRELRSLVADAVGGLGGEGQGPATRRRVD